MPSAGDLGLRQLPVAFHLGAQDVKRLIRRGAAHAAQAALTGQRDRRHRVQFSHRAGRFFARRCIPGAQIGQFLFQHVEIGKIRHAALNTFVHDPFEMAHVLERLTVKICRRTAFFGLKIQHQPVINTFVAAFRQGNSGHFHIRLGNVALGCLAAVIEEDLVDHQIGRHIAQRGQSDTRGNRRPPVLGRRFGAQLRHMQFRFGHARIGSQHTRSNLGIGASRRQNALPRGQFCDDRGSLLHRDRFGSGRLGLACHICAQVRLRGKKP
ncbi:hypothetical protein MCRY_18555 [Marivita cryptomonadis]|nr:hypothetical protein MCRY_18555 [Marivita cryptomonadis]